MKQVRNLYSSKYKILMKDTGDGINGNNQGLEELTLLK